MSCLLHDVTVVLEEQEETCTFPRVFDLNIRSHLVSQLAYLWCSILYVELERKMKKQIVLLLKSELHRL